MYPYTMCALCVCRLNDIFDKDIEALQVAGRPKSDVASVSNFIDGKKGDVPCTLLGSASILLGSNYDIDKSFPSLNSLSQRWRTACGYLFLKC